MNTRKYILIAFLLGVAFSLINSLSSDKKELTINTINKDDSVLDVSLKMHESLDLLEFSSNETISRVLIHDSNGKVIRKEKPTSNVIYLNELKNQELFVSFISTNNNMAFKSILF